MTLTAKGWLKVKAKRSHYGVTNPNSGKKPVDALRITGVSVNKPTVEDDEEAVEVVLEFPSDYFDTAHPKVKVAIPAPDPSDLDIKTTAQVTKGRKVSAAAAVIHGEQP